MVTQRFNSECLYLYPEHARASGCIEAEAKQRAKKWCEPVRSLKPYSSSQRNPMGAPDTGFDTRALAARTDMVPLSHGNTWIHETGPTSGQPLLMIHGATIPHWSFERLVPHLAAAGFRVLCFDLYGHGRSAKPGVDYTLTLFRQQAEELLATLEFPQPVAVLGHSLGAAIAADLCRHNPGTVNRLVLVAPLWNFSDHSRWSGMIRNRLTGPVTLRHLALPALRIRRRRRYAAIGLEHLGERFGDESRGAGFEHALLSMERCGTLGCQRERYRALGWLRCPRLLISADEDRIAPPAHVSHVRSLIQPCQNHVFKGREHNLMLTDPASVSDSISAFLKDNPIRDENTDSIGTPAQNQPEPLRVIKP